MDSRILANEAVYSRLGVQRSDGPVYVPYDALNGVAGGRVVLTVSAAEVPARLWRYRPTWLPSPGRLEPVPWAS